MNMRAALGVALLASSVAAGAGVRIAVPESTARRKTGGGGGMIPDRVSIEEGSPHFFRLYTGLGVRIDGVESDSVVEFCQSERWVRLCFWTPTRRMRRERGRIVTTLRENVEVEPYWRGGTGDRQAALPAAPPPRERTRPEEHQHSGEIARRRRQAAAREAKLAARAAAR